MARGNTLSPSRAAARRSGRVRAQNASGNAPRPSPPRDAKESKIIIEVAEEANSDNDDSANRQLVEDMNKEAGKPRRIGIHGAASTPRATATTTSTAKRKRGRPSEDARPSASKRHKAITEQQVGASGGYRIEIPTHGPSAGGLKRHPISTKPRPRSWAQDITAYPIDEEPAASSGKKTRVLNKRHISNPSPFKGKKDVDKTVPANVSLDDTIAVEHVEQSRRERQHSGDADPDYESVQNSGADTESEDRDENAQEKVVEAKVEMTDDELRQEYCQKVQSLIQVHDCAEHWGTLFVSAERIREGADKYGSDSDRDGAESGVGKAAARALDAVDRLYSSRSIDWMAAETASAAAMAKIKLVTETERLDETTKRGRDLHTCIIPRLEGILNAILEQIKPDLESTEEHLTPLLDMLENTEEVLERARKWAPRPSSLAGSEILGRIRDEFAPSVMKIKQAYNGYVTHLRRIEESKRTALAHEKRKAHWQEMKRREEAERAWRIRSFEEAARKRCRELDEEDRRPLREITRTVAPQVHDIDEFSDSAADEEIYRDPIEAVAGTVSVPWTEAENALLLSALQMKFPQENRFSELYRRYGQRLPGRNIDDIRRQATFLKRSLMTMVEERPDEEHKYWGWLISIPG